MVIQDCHRLSGHFQALFEVQVLIVIAAYQMFSPERFIASWLPVKYLQDPYLSQPLLKILGFFLIIPNNSCYPLYFYCYYFILLVFIAFMHK